jgi:hypothetical protein
MAAESSVANRAVAGGDASDMSTVYAEGLRAGLIGAATIAIWFLILDIIQGRPFFTPTVLGTALFRGGEGLAAPEALPSSFEMVVTFTWVHVLAFILIGTAAAYLLSVAERDPGFGFGIVLLFVVFEFGFVVACMLFAEPVLHALTWTGVLVGNLLAAMAMTVVFWRRHPRLSIAP